MATRPSAVSRTPTEIWAIILKYAVYSPRPPFQVNGRSYSAHKAEDGNIYDDNWYSSMQRADSMSNTIKLSVVCRAWKEIIYPSFLQWIVISTIGQMSPALRLLRNSSGYQTKGCLVRRLEFKMKLGIEFDSSDEDYADYLEALGSTYVKLIPNIIQECPNLEELDYDTGTILTTSTNLCSVLGATCGRTFRHVRICSGFQASAKEMSTLLDQCPHLETLVFQECNDIFTDIPPSFPLVVPMSLHSLSWFATSTTVIFLERLAALDMPQLRHIGMTLAFGNAEGASLHSVHTVLAPKIKSFIKAHGSKLLSLEIDMAPGIEEDEWLAFKLLDLCPNLEDLVFDFIRTLKCPLKRPHGTLRRIICHSLFLYPFAIVPSGSPELIHHLEDVHSSIDTFCGPDFPQLQVIKCLDLLPPEAWEARVPSDPPIDGLPEEYRTLVREAISKCVARGIRFVNLTGELVGQDFFPVIGGEDEEGENGQ